MYVFACSSNTSPSRAFSPKLVSGYIKPLHYDDWLGSTNPEFARALIELYPADELSAQPAMKETTKRVDATEQLAKHNRSSQATLF